LSDNLADDLFSLFRAANFLAVLSIDFINAESVVAMKRLIFACSVPQIPGGEISHLASPLCLWSFASFTFGKS